MLQAGAGPVRDRVQTGGAAAGNDNSAMNLLLVLALLGIGATFLKNAEQRQRILWLGQHLQHHQIEKLMEGLIDGYLRALGEQDAERRASVLNLLASTEETLSGQLQRLAADLRQLDDRQARTSRLPMGLPLVTRLLPGLCFDLRELVALHAAGFEAVRRNDEGLDRRDQAFRLSAELLLFQHSCHWYCRSRAVASARLLARHRTSHEQVLAAVSPATREAYRALTGVA